MPFLIFFAIEAVVLILLYLAPRMPLRQVLGPPVKSFWGERFLHYPLNFILLPKLISHAQVVLSVIFGSFLTGWAVAIVYKRKLRDVLSKYSSFLLIVFVTVFLCFFATRLFNSALYRYFTTGHTRLLFLNFNVWAIILAPLILFLLPVLIQAFFIYMIPAIVLEDKRLFRSIIRAFRFSLKYFLFTFSIILIPMLLYVPFMILNQQTLFIVKQVFPELVFWILFCSLAVTALVIDPLITITIAIAYKNFRMKNEA